MTDLTFWHPIVAAIFAVLAAIILGTLFFDAYGALKRVWRRRRRKVPFAVDGFFEGHESINVHLKDRTLIPRVRLVGFRQKDAVMEDAPPHLMNMIALESEDGRRICLDPTAIRMLEAVPPTGTPAQRLADDLERHLAGRLKLEAVERRLHAGVYGDAARYHTLGHYLCGAELRTRDPTTRPCRRPRCADTSACCARRPMPGGWRRSTFYSRCGMSDIAPVWTFTAAMLAGMAAIMLGYQLAERQAHRRLPAAGASSAAWRLRADLRGGGLLLLGVGLAMPVLVVATFAHAPAPGDAWWGLLIGICAGVFACWGWHLWRTTIRLDATGILAAEADGLFAAHLDWGAVRRIRYDLHRDALLVEGEGRSLAVSVHLADYAGFIARLRQYVPDARMDFDPALMPWALRDANAPPAAPWPLLGGLLAALAGLLATLHEVPPHRTALLLAAASGVFLTLPAVWQRLARRWSALHRLRAPTWEVGALMLAIGFFISALGEMDRVLVQTRADAIWLLTALQLMTTAAIAALLVLLTLLATRRRERGA